ncbi:MAG TPA: DUF2853 family protein [Lacisediminihabitans sp.]|uniref:DUF2853 family protein n=1 Tax=Lacisediminihabitans sp. TaxID=2787631 RepID=UPI002ED87AAF
MDYIADVQKYTSAVDESVVQAMAATYRLVLSRADSAVIAFGDPGELARVKKNFLIRKLGLSESDDLDGAIAEVGAKMKGVSRRNRLTVYYLLAEHFGKLDVLK